MLWFETLLWRLGLNSVAVFSVFLSSPLLSSYLLSLHIEMPGTLDLQLLCKQLNKAPSRYMGYSRVYFYPTMWTYNVRQAYFYGLLLTLSIIIDYVCVCVKLGCTEHHLSHLPRRSSCG